MRPKIHILHSYKVFYPDVFGGIPYVIDIVSRLAPEKFEQSILVTSKTPRPIEVSNGVVLESVRSWGDLMSLPIAPIYPFVLWLRSRKADVLMMHAPFPLADLVFGLFLRRRQKLVIYWHSHIVSQKLIYRLIKPLIRRSLKRADRIIISHPTIAYAGSILEAFRDKCAIIPYAVDTDIFNSDSGAAFKQELDGEKLPLVAACGRLVKYKGFDVLIEAARHIQARIAIVGEGTERDALQFLINEAGLNHRVELVGSLSQCDLIALLNAASVFAFPSISSAETFGIAQVEAMACGCAIVNTQIPTAVPEVARHGIEALTISPGDVIGLAAAINTLLTDDAMRCKLSTNARARASALYDQATYQSRLEELLCSISESCAENG